MGRQASSRVDISGQPLIGCVDLVLHRESNTQPVCSTFQERVVFYYVIDAPKSVRSEDMCDGRNTL